MAEANRRTHTVAVAAFCHPAAWQGQGCLSSVAPTGELCISSGQAPCPPHQLAHPDAATGRESGSGSRPRDGGGGGEPAGAAAIRGGPTRLPKVLAAGVVRVPRDSACWTAISAPRDVAGHRVETTPPAVAATDAKARIFSYCYFVQPEALWRGWSFTNKKKWLHTLGNWSNIKHNKIYSIHVHS
jgi:hypothetical protein